MVHQTGAGFYPGTPTARAYALSVYPLPATPGSALLAWQWSDADGKPRQRWCVGWPEPAPNRAPVTLPDGVTWYTLPAAMPRALAHWPHLARHRPTRTARPGLLRAAPTPHERQAGAVTASIEIVTRPATTIEIVTRAGRRRRGPQRGASHYPPHVRAACVACWRACRAERLTAGQFRARLAVWLAEHDALPDGALPSTKAITRWAETLS